MFQGFWFRNNYRSYKISKYSQTIESELWDILIQVSSKNLSAGKERLN